jgi:hypothetical protein
MERHMSADDPMELPGFSYTIPEDADPATKEYMRAQVVIQAAFHAFGDRNLKPGTATLPIVGVREVLAAAMGMMLALDSSLKTPRDVRIEAERLTKFVRTYADAIRSSPEASASILDALNMTMTRPS